MEQKKTMDNKTWSRIFLIIGLFALFDLATRGAVREQYNLDFGWVSLAPLLLLNPILGPSVAAAVATLTLMVCDFSIVWLILAYVFHRRQKSDAGISNFIDEYNERVTRGATSGKSYNAETFEKIWEITNFSDKEIFGISWSELDREKIEKRLSNLGLKIRSGKSPTLIGFNAEFVPGDTVDGSISILKNRSHFKDGLHCSFGFVDKKADKLVEWIEKKYGKSLKLRDDTAGEYYYDWLVGDILITVNIVKLSGLGDMTFESMPGYAKMVRGEIGVDEFSKNYLKQG
ncbi:MAG: hypothetical protein Q7K38_02885 [Candidatus Wildermuthbacteria bacterium]|nr:hypothetical protein [Candidatus Wildermuthbacteria bacterium]